MCGRLNVIDDAGVQALLKQLNIDLWPEPFIHSRFVRATQPVSIVREIKAGAGGVGSEHLREVRAADWWLLQERTETSFKPSKYTSFNTRYDKLNAPRSAGYKPFRETRCIIPAKGFGETEFVNKKPKHYFDMQAVEGEAIAFGGLYKEWHHPDTGEWKLSCSVITLPPHPKIQNIHSKAMPLILPQKGSWMDAWLNPKTDPQSLLPLLTPHLPQSLIAQQINKPSEYQGIAEPFVIKQDV